MTRQEGAPVEITVTAWPGKVSTVDFVRGASGFQYDVQELEIIGNGDVMVGVKAVEEAFGDAPQVRTRSSLTAIADKMVLGFEAQPSPLEVQT